MPQKLPTIIDNRNENTVLAALKLLLPRVNALDIATGYFEVGSLLALDGLWQRLAHVRLLMGDETTKRTKQFLLSTLLERVNASIETAKETDDALTGLGAVRHAFQTKQIQARIYTRAKFHAKAYLFETDAQQLSDYALVGSSNFTKPGLTQNLELNVLTTDALHLQALRTWFYEVWQEGEDVAPDIIQIIEPHLREYLPFEIFAQALYAYFEGREKPITHWETRDSVMWQVLSPYQRDGYRSAVQIANTWRGALICDGVGLGKTFIGLMLLEYHLARGEDVLLIVPKSALASVWEANIARYLKPKYAMLLKKNLTIKKHTDFGRHGTIDPEELQFLAEHADAILIDEAHHFRNPLRTRGKKLRQISKNKNLYLMTATPINNSLDDLYHLLNYFAQGQRDYFARLGENNLRKRFLDAEKKLEQALQQGGDLKTLAETQDFLRTDSLLKNLIIQRSRAYVKAAEMLAPTPPLFPERQTPHVVAYSLAQVYAELYNELKRAFDKTEPLLNLKIYAPEQFRRGNQDKQILQHEKQLVGLIRTLFLKRLESSWKAFEASVEELLSKMEKFLQANAPQEAEQWRAENASAWNLVQQHQRERAGEDLEEDEELEDLPALNPDAYALEMLLPLVQSDMSVLVNLLRQLYERFYDGETDASKQLQVAARKDAKLQKLMERLSNRELLGQEKVVVFTEFRDTARYLHKALTQLYGLTQLEELDSSTRDETREGVIKRFAPYYNCAPHELDTALASPIRVLISTDVLSEGLNLQDARQIVNYDLHWNPVRLMQRIGRVDRRLNPAIEQMIGRAEEKPLRVFVHNFLPPYELDDLLKLVRRINGKVLRISKTLGIEAPIGLPDEPQAVLKNFNATYEGGGTKSIEEDARLELERIAAEHPELYAQLKQFPRRVLSGKHNANDLRGVFCVYRFPETETVLSSETRNLLSSAGHSDQARDFSQQRREMTPPRETATTRERVRWYLYDASNGAVYDSIEAIYNAVRCEPKTPRRLALTWQERNDARKTLEAHIRNTELVADPNRTAWDEKPILVCWMELN